MQLPARPSSQLLMLSPCKQTDIASLPAQLSMLAFALSHNIAHQVNTNSAANLKSQHAALDPSLPGSRYQGALPSTAPPQCARTTAENACYRRWTNNTLCAANDWQLSVSAQRYGQACIAKAVYLTKVSRAALTHLACVRPRIVRQIGPDNFV